MIRQLGLFVAIVFALNATLTPCQAQCDCGAPVYSTSVYQPCQTMAPMQAQCGQASSYAMPGVSPVPMVAQPIIGNQVPSRRPTDVEVTYQQCVGPQYNGTPCPVSKIGEDANFKYYALGCGVGPCPGCISLSISDATLRISKDADDLDVSGNCCNCDGIQVPVCGTPTFPSCDWNRARPQGCVSPMGFCKTLAECNGMQNTSVCPGVIYHQDSTHFYMTARCCSPTQIGCIAYCIEDAVFKFPHGTRVVSGCDPFNSCNCFQRYAQFLIR